MKKSFCDLLLSFFPGFINICKIFANFYRSLNAGEGVEKREPSYTVGGNAN